MRLGLCQGWDTPFRMFLCMWCSQTLMDPDRFHPEGPMMPAWVQGASVVIPGSYSASPAGMELVGLCRRACRGPQPAAPAQAPAPPPPAILI